MGKKLDGTDNVYVLGVKGDTDPPIPAMTTEQIDEMLKESLSVQYLQIKDFVGDIEAMGDKPDHVVYGSLMRYLQQECVLHLSALAAAAVMRVSDLEDILRSK